MTMSNKFVREGPILLKSSVIVFLLKSEIMVETTVTDLEYLNVMKVIEFQGIKTSGAI